MGYYNTKYYYTPLRVGYYNTKYYCTPLGVGYYNTKYYCTPLGVGYYNTKYYCTPLRVGYYNTKYYFTTWALKTNRSWYPDYVNAQQLTWSDSLVKSPCVTIQNTLLAPFCFRNSAVFTMESHLSAISSYIIQSLSCKKCWVTSYLTVVYDYILVVVVVVVLYARFVLFQYII